MAFLNPDDSTEILYGNSGDIRNEVNANAAASTAGHYVDENEMPGALVIRSIRRATRLVNSFVEPAYAAQVPFAATGDVPKILDEIGTDIAMFYCLRSLAANLGPVDEAKKRDYFDQYVGADGFLTQIRDRRLQLPELTASYADDAKAVRASDVAPIFDVDSEFNQGVDSRLLDDIEDERND